MVVSVVKCKLDFSQFYLPPCCLTFSKTPPPPLESFPSYASRTAIGGNSKREVSREGSNFEPVAKNVAINNSTRSFYTLIIPIKGEVTSTDRIFESINEKYQGNHHQQKRYTTSSPRLVVPESQNDDINFGAAQSHLAESKFLQNFLNSELEKNADMRKGTIGIKSYRVSRSPTNVETDSNSYMEHGTVEPQIQSRIVNKFINWESKRVPGNNSENITSQKHQLFPVATGLQNAATEHTNHQVVKRIPSSWVKYLKRALYQSITDGQGIIDGKNSVYTRHDEPAKLIKFKIRFPETWKSIKSAHLQYVDKMAQVSTTPYGTIYLPSEEGPIVSGILVNSPHGHLHLRVASELYFPSQEHSPYNVENCGCYLFSPGEILVAYWAVSRVFKENGQPALQYLVYPLPHSVPTPPKVFPFSANEMFHPSSIDPFTSFYENAQNSQNHVELQQQNDQMQLHIQQQHQLNYNSNKPHRGHPHTIITRNSKPDPAFVNHQNYFHLNQLEGILPSPQPHYAHRGPVGVGEGLNLGVILQNGQPYPDPGLLEQYNNALQINAFIDPNVGYHSIPYSDLNIHMPIKYDLPSQVAPEQPLSLLSPPPSEPDIHGSQELGNGPPISVNPTNLPAVVPEQQEEVQLPKPPTFPKSIQDIISPHNIQQQHQSEQMLPPPDAQIPPMIQPILPIEQLPFIVNYPPRFPPAYMDFNIHNSGQRIANHLTPNEDHTKQRKGIGKHQILNNNKTNHKPDTKKVEQNKDTKYDTQRPYTISNLVDNEKKYYPIRQPKPYNSGFKYSDKYQQERQRWYYKQKLVNDINNKGGYILDF